MHKPLTHSEIRELAATSPPREDFGPQSNYPYIVFELGNTDADLASWLQDLPCPVIGVGDGELGTACDVVLPNTEKLPTLSKNITNAPMAAMILVQHLRASEKLSMTDALTAESFAYAALQTGPEFLAWLAVYDKRELPNSDEPPLLIDMASGELSITLNRPDTHNAIGTEMRDALCEALDLAMVDTSISRVNLKGAGRTFSTGGAIEEFGEVSDPATAHWVRSLRLPAWRLARLEDKLHIHVGGAAIGAGAEIAAFGKHVTASKDAWFQLPELKYGLIPGAGGTASLPRRIGRQRTAYMALTMEKIRAETALDWGLIDAV